MNIYLVGYSYGGKTTLGKQLAQRLGYTFFDTDKAIELKYHVSIPIFFQHYGEQAFRIIERQILLSTAELDHTVVATGGGLPCQADNMDFILAHGTAVYTQLTVDDVMERLTWARRSRPLLVGKSDDERRQYIAEQLAKRDPYYQRAPLTLPADRANVDELLRIVTAAGIEPLNKGTSED